MVAVAFISAAPSVQRRQPQDRDGQPPRVGRQASDVGRIETRTYLFKETNQRIDYAVFVPPTVNPRARSSLVIALHGQGVQPAGVVRPLMDEASRNRYIVAAPMGYSLDGWYGIDGPAPAAAGKPGLAELSERDVMNVLGLVREEFNIDNSRIYLLGQSMGGAGALYRGVKYRQIWAAVAAIAPAAGALNPTLLERARELPIILVHGKADETVPVERSRPWAAKLAELKMAYEYDEIPNVGHFEAISAGSTRVFAFFSKHQKTAGKP
jgi:predicted peptidase